MSSRIIDYSNRYESDSQLPSVLRRELLKIMGIGLVASAGLSQSVGAQSTSGGNEKWTFETDNSVQSSPTVVDGIVFVGSENNTLYALDTADGTEQ